MPSRWRSSASVQAKIHSIVLASAAPGFAFLHKRGWRTPGPRNANANPESTRRWLVATRRFLELLDGAVPVRLEIEKSVPLARVYNQSCPAPAAGEVQRATFLAIETGDLPRQQHETNARSRSRRRLVGVGRLEDHERHVAGAGLFDEVSAY